MWSVRALGRRGRRQGAEIARKGFRAWRYDVGGARGARCGLQRFAIDGVRVLAAEPWQSRRQATVGDEHSLHGLSSGAQKIADSLRGRHGTS